MFSTWMELDSDNDLSHWDEWLESSSSLCRLVTNRARATCGNSASSNCFIVVCTLGVVTNKDEKVEYCWEIIHDEEPEIKFPNNFLKFLIKRSKLIRLKK
jgi:hypothetical protein